jgi:hypothetical protein
MRLLSSRWTFFYKRVFPLIWFGFLAFCALFAVFIERAHGRFDPLVLLGPAVMMGIGYVIMRGFVFDLADEVVDAGNALVVRKSGDEVRIPLADIINVDCATFTNPPRITLTLRTPCRFGRKIVFSPPPKRFISFNPFAPNPIGEELIDRVDRARRGS